MGRILLLVRDSRYFLTHRLALAQMLQREGHTVRVLCALADQKSWDMIMQAGIELRATPFLSVAAQPWRALSCLGIVLQEVARFQPDRIFSVTVLANLCAGITARLWRKRHIALMAGLGTLFHTQSARVRLLRPVAIGLYRLALRRHGTTVIFQNEADRQIFLTAGICKPDQCQVIPGSGVDPDAFPFQPYALHRQRPRRVGFIARMLRDKGVFEFIAASQTILASRQDVEFVLIGGVDAGNPTSLQESDLEALSRTTGIRWLGHQEDIPQQLQSLDIFCLPSYHEGLPKAVLEAAAAGCALVVSDIPGCTAFVEHGVNGITVPKKDAQALAASIVFLLDRPETAQEMTQAARHKIETRFSDRIVLGLYQRLILS